MNLKHCGRIHPYSWYLEAPSHVLREFRIESNDLVVVSLRGVRYLCVARKREKLKVTIGGSVIISESVENTFNDEICVHKITPRNFFHSEQDTITMRIPSAFCFSSVENKARSILKDVLHGMPYLCDTWMLVRTVMTNLKVRVGKTGGDGDTIQMEYQFKPHWIGDQAIKARLQHCMSAPSVLSFIVAGARGTGKMTLLKDCLHTIKPFSCLMVSASDLLVSRKECKEYQSDEELTAFQDTNSNRVLVQIEDMRKSSFISNYQRFVRELGTEFHMGTGVSYSWARRGAAQGVETPAHLLTSIFMQAYSYHFLIIREFDAAFVQRSDLASPEQRQLTSTLLMLIDEMRKAHVETRSRCKIIALAADLSKIDTALRRPGRFEETVILSNPTFSLRLSFLRTHINADDKQTPELESLVESMSSMSLGDIKTFLEMRPNASVEELRGSIGTYIQEFRRCNILELSSELASCRVPDQTPHTPLELISVHNGVLQQLIDIILMPVQHRDLYVKLVRRCSSGNILLVGPTGSGKTFMVKRLVKRLSGRIAFFELNCAQVFSLYVGQSEQNIRRAFREARENMPSVLIVDNYDSLVGDRASGSMADDSVATRVLATFLVELDGISSNAFEQLTVLAMTSRPELIDKALLRPGRIDHRLSIDCIPQEDILQEEMWDDIGRIYHSSPSNLTLLKEHIRERYSRGAQMTIGDIVKIIRLLSSGVISLEYGLASLDDIPQDDKKEGLDGWISAK